MILAMQHFFVRVFAAGSPQVGQPLPVSFETAVAALEQLPQMFTEPDGSFVWRSPPGVTPPWQVEGTLVDGGATLLYVELKGCCPAPAWEQLLACFSHGPTRFAIESVLEGRTMNNEEMIVIHWP